MNNRLLIAILHVFLLIQPLITQSVEIQGEAIITQMINDNHIDDIVVRKPDGTLATRSAQSLPSSFQDTTRTLRTDLELAKHMCECGTDLPPFMIEALKDAGYTNQDLIKAGVPITNIIDLNTTVTDIDGNVYDVTTIGTQKWMKQNLKATKYNDGTSIPLTLGDDIWYDLNEDEASGYTYPNGNINNVPEYGLLYTSYTVNPTFNSGKNVCPVGWRVPSREDFDDLRESIEPGSSSFNNTVGSYLKKEGTVEWNSPNVGANNLTEFDGIPAGNRDRDGIYSGFGILSLYNTTYESGLSATYANTLQNNMMLFKDQLSIRQDAGNSIRCINSSAINSSRFTTKGNDFI